MVDGMLKSNYCYYNLYRYHIIFIYYKYNTLKLLYTFESVCFSCWQVMNALVSCKPYGACITNYVKAVLVLVCFTLCASLHTCVNFFPQQPWTVNVHKPWQ